MTLRKTRSTKLMLALILVAPSMLLFSGAAADDAQMDAALPDASVMEQARPMLLEITDDPVAIAEDVPVPATAEGIGPGTRIEMRIEGSTYGCTANFIWKDANGDLYLGAAGHCFLPSGKDTTHGPGDQYANYKDVVVTACYQSCKFGGVTGFLLSGQTTRLGEVAYARQASASGGGIGWDFGLVKLPLGIHHLLRPEMPVWGGPEGTAPVQFGSTLMMYGNGVVTGETWPTMARVGTGILSSDEYYVAHMPASSGDSGAPVTVADPVVGTDLYSVKAAGIHTHGLGTVKFGTTLAQAQAMALNDAGLDVEIVLAGGLN